MTESTERTVNVPLLRKAVEFVEAQEALPTVARQWDQMQWVDIYGECGTTYCVAGWLAMQDDPDYADNAEPDGKPHAAVHALNLLGLHKPHGLFHCNNTAADVRRIAEELAGERL